MPYLWILITLYSLSYRVFGLQAGDWVEVTGALVSLRDQSHLFTSDGFVISVQRYPPLAHQFGHPIRLIGVWGADSVPPTLILEPGKAAHDDSQVDWCLKLTMAQRECKEFLTSYREYTTLLEQHVAKGYSQQVHEHDELRKDRQPVPEGLLVSVEEPVNLAVIRKDGFLKYQRQYFQWMARYRELSRKFLRARMDKRVRLGLRLIRADYLLLLEDLDQGEILRIFPVAYGYNPDGAGKVEAGDGRTPRSPAGILLADSPHTIVRKTSKSCAPGMTAACLGIGSRLAADQFWVQHGMNIVLHGSEEPYTIGTRSSNGCIRLLNSDARTLYALSDIGMPILMH